MMYEVKKRGAELYPDNQREIQFGKGFITINSHYLTHTPMYIRVYRAPRMYWVFVYESILGELKNISKVIEMASRKVL
jgi:hypothetical protein